MQRKWVRSSIYRNAISKLVGARRQSGMSQRALAEALGKPPSWVAKVEQMERRLDVLEFVAIARALGLSETELLKTITSGLPKRLDI